MQRSRKVLNLFSLRVNSWKNSSGALRDGESFVERDLDNWDIKSSVDSISLSRSDMSRRRRESFGSCFNGFIIK